MSFWVLPLLTMCGLLLNSRAAIQDGFQLDGDAVSVSSDPLDDWDRVYTDWANKGVVPLPARQSGATIFTFTPDDTLDSSFTGGSKDDQELTNWSWANSSVSGKTDLQNAVVAIYGDSELYFATDRTVDTGDAAIGFWLFKAPVSLGTAGKFVGQHTVGDILLASHFTKGGGVSTIVAYEWVGSGGSDGALNKLNLADANLYAIVNASPCSSQGK